MFKEEVRCLETARKGIVEDEKKEWKFKMSMEIHSEPTAASLASALGLYTDITKKVGEFKIYIGKQTHDEFFVDFVHDDKLFLVLGCQSAYYVLVFLL